MLRMRSYKLMCSLVLAFCMVAIGVFTPNAYAISCETAEACDASTALSSQSATYHISQDVELSAGNPYSITAFIDTNEIDGAPEIPRSNWVISDNVLTIDGEGIVGRNTLVDSQKKEIKRIVIKEGVVGIKGETSGVFNGFESVDTIELPSSLTYIGKNAFKSCYSLRSIEIPSNVRTIGESAFQQCRALASVKLGINTRSIADYSFADCPSLVDVTFNEGLETIGSYVFTQFKGNDGGAALTEADLPSSLTSIGNSAFKSLKKLKSVSIPGNTDIGKNAFAFCSELDVVAFGHTKSIGANAFRSCTSLKQAQIDSGSIGQDAFQGCNSLDAVKISSVTWIGSGAFADCNSLTTLEFVCSAPEVQSTLVKSRGSTCIIYPVDDDSWSDDVRKAISANPNNMKVREADGSTTDAPKIPYVSSYTTIKVPFGTSKTEIIDPTDPFKIARSFDFDIADKQSTRLILTATLPCYHAGFLYTIKNWIGEEVYWGAFSHKDDTEKIQTTSQQINLELDSGTYHVEVFYTQSHKGGGSGWFTVGVYESANQGGNGFDFREGEVKVGSSDVAVTGHLGGSLRESDLLSLWVVRRTSGDEYEKVVANCSNRVLGVYSAVLTVNGTTQHANFGSIDLSFPVPEEYNGKQVKIHHLHMSDLPVSSLQAGQITNENVVVRNSKATITVEDLSLFAVEEVTYADGNGGNGNSSDMNASNGNGTGIPGDAQAGTTNRTNTTTPLVQTGASTANGSSSGKTGLVQTGDVVGYSAAGASLLAILAVLIIVGRKRKHASAAIGPQKEEASFDLANADFETKKKAFYHDKLDKMIPKL